MKACIMPRGLLTCTRTVDLNAITDSIAKICLVMTTHKVSKAFDYLSGARKMTEDDRWYVDMSVMANIQCCGIVCSMYVFTA